MVAPVGSDIRCLIRHILKLFGAITNIYKANIERSAEESVEPRKPHHILKRRKRKRKKNQPSVSYSKNRVCLVLLILINSS